MMTVKPICCACVCVCVSCLNPCIIICIVFYCLAPIARPHVFIQYLSWLTSHTSHSTSSTVEQYFPDLSTQRLWYVFHPFAHHVHDVGFPDHDFPTSVYKRGQSGPVGRQPEYDGVQLVRGNGSYAWPRSMCRDRNKAFLSEPLGDAAVEWFFYPLNLHTILLICSIKPVKTSKTAA